MEIYCDKFSLPNSINPAFIQTYLEALYFVNIYFIYFFSPRSLFLASSNTESSLHTANRK